MNSRVTDSEKMKKPHLSINRHSGFCKIKKRKCSFLTKNKSDFQTKKRNLKKETGFKKEAELKKEQFKEKEKRRRS